jgi:hypothetical protein
MKSMGFRMNPCLKCLASLLWMASLCQSVVAASPQIGQRVIHSEDFTKRQTGWVGAFSGYDLRKESPNLGIATRGTSGAGLYLSAGARANGVFAFASRAVTLKPLTVYRLDVSAQARRQSAPLKGQQHPYAALPFKMGAVLSNPMPRADFNGWARADLHDGPPLGEFGSFATIGNFPGTRSKLWQTATFSNARSPLWLRTGVDGRVWLIAGFDADGAARHTVALQSVRYVFSEMQLSETAADASTYFTWRAPWRLQNAAADGIWRDEPLARSPYQVPATHPAPSWRLRPPSVVMTDGVKYPNEATLLTYRSQSAWTQEYEANEVTYSFHPTDAIYYEISYPLGSVSGAHATAFRQLFKELEQIANLRFVELTPRAGGSLADVASRDPLLSTLVRDTPPDLAPQDKVVDHYGAIHIGQFLGSDAGFAGRGIRPSDNPLSGDLHLAVNPEADPAPGDLSGLRTVMLHELGHVLGLSHPFDSKSPLSKFRAGGQIEFGRADQFVNTVMTYNLRGPWPGTWMLYDVLALQELYGAGISRPGDTLYRFQTICGIQVSGTDETIGSVESLTKVTVWDSGGTDTFDFSALPAFASGYDLRLGQGRLSSQRGARVADAALTAVAFGAEIENLVGSSSTDWVEGTPKDNRISGLAGNDFIDGGSGSDTAIYRGQRRDYLATYDASRDCLRLRDTVASRDGEDLLKNCEIIEFSDESVLSTEILR